MNFRLPQAVAAAGEARLTDDRASGVRGVLGETPNEQSPARKRGGVFVPGGASGEPDALLAKSLKRYMDGRR